MPSAHVRLPRLVGLGLLKSESTLFKYSSFFFHVTFRSICQMLVNFCGAIFRRSVSRFKKRIRESLSCVYVLYRGEIRKFPVLVVQRRQRNVQKSVMHLQNYRLNNQNLLIVSLPFSLLSSLLSLS